MVFALGGAKKYTKAPDTAGAPGGLTQEELEAGRIPEESVTEMDIAGRDAAAESDFSLDEQEKSTFRDIYFDYDRYDIRAEARPVLDGIASFLKNYGQSNIVIEGHCDDRGTNEYNLALGENRAKAAKNYLVSRGVSPDRIIVITFGEEKPVCTDPVESCWQQNRRAHFVSVKSRFP